MKPEQLYQELKELAEKLGITVSERSFRHTGMNIRSGLCKIRDQYCFIMDKHLPQDEKNHEIASCLRKMPLDDMFIVPIVREFLDKPET